jgi:cyanophycinase
MVLDRVQADGDEFASAIRGVSVVYFTGGNPDHLLATLRGSKLLLAVLDRLANGGVVGGSSAGAMVMGSMMRRPRSGEWVEALGIAPGLAVLPHHERSDPATVSRELARTAPTPLKVLGIDARTCCFGLPGSWRVLGPGKVTAYLDAAWTVYRAGETLPSTF